MVRELAGRAGARVLAALGIAVSRHTALRVLLGIPLPALAVPQVLGIDDFALRRSRRYATVLIDAGTGQRVDVLPGRTADVVEAWLREHPGVQIVCRDGSGRLRRGGPPRTARAVQVSDRWHLWHGLAEAAQKEVAAHSACWAKAGPPPQAGTRAQTTAERWQQVHALLGKDVGPAGMRPPPEPVPEHRQALRPRQRARAAAARPAVPGHAGRSLPRPPAHAAALRTPRCRCSNCCARSGNSATRAAPTCSSATSPRAASRPTGRTCHPAARPGSC